HWDLIEVTARLDAAGTLHVRERQHFVFTGDWNGGERRFRVDEGQRLRILGMRRIDAAGAAVDLRAGDLAAVDEYRFSGDVLRWRSRLPADPEFDRTPLVYEIDYELGRILVASGGGAARRYRLDHDFAFGDRPGAIERFTLGLELDPAWRPNAALPERFTAGPLEPGASFVVSRELAYSGEGEPEAAFGGPAPLVRAIVLVLLLAGIPAIFVRFWLGERARGRFPREVPAIDEAWLEEHILHQLPEVIGYMADGKSGPPEVAAILARMAQEGKITSRVEPRRLRGPLLHMTLVDTGAPLEYQEQQLVHMFFFGGAQETDTDTIRKHYRQRGFDPGKTIEPNLAGAALRHPDWREDVPYRWEPLDTRVLLAAYVLLVSGALFGSSSLWLMIYMGVLGGAAFAIGRGLARGSANRMRRLPLWWLGAAVPTLLVAWLLATIARQVSHVRDYALLVAAAFVLVVYWLVMRAARTDQSREKVLLRTRIEAARRWFASELRRPTPRLRDEWAPYLIALGLGRHAERWFSSFGGQVAASAAQAGRSVASASASASSVAGGASAAGSSWTGGGGAVGGGGATTSWALVATSRAAGSSPPATSSSGGGGSSSGGSSSSSSSSSGGGGGGGW
ncbi:MAG TPA: hypothetical protein VFS60_02835, partial [Thermoanaerobaculia bacterium]|nr:hypothetical protein [Thermoanaerobaculia bacterium]